MANKNYLRSILSAAGVLSLGLLLAGCEPAGLSPSQPDEVMRFTAAEAVPDLMTKSGRTAAAPEAAAAAENVLVLTAPDGRTIRLVADQEPLSARAAAPGTKASKVYGSGDATPLGGAPIGVWAYNSSANATAFGSWVLDWANDGSSERPASPVKAGYDSPKKGLWAPATDIPYGKGITTNPGAWYARFFAVAPYAAFEGGTSAPAIPSIRANNAPTLQYTIPAAVGNQLDLLAAQSGVRKLDDSSPVDLTFMHVLTGVRFKRDKDLAVRSITLGGVYDRATLQLQKIPMTPQPLSSGTAPSLSSFTNVDNTGAETDLWADRTKSVTAPSWTMDMTASGTWTNGRPGDATKETQYDYAAGDANILMMIPQWTPEGATITVNIAGTEYTGDISGHRWLPGRLVTYRIDEELKFFSVSDSKRVRFAPGNVQFSATLNADGSYTDPVWKFADHQWDYIYNAADYDVPASGSKSVTYDLFGWATAGVKNDNGDYGADETMTRYQPWAKGYIYISNTDNCYSYGPSTTRTYWTKSDNLPFQMPNYDPNPLNTWVGSSVHRYCDWGVHFDKDGVGLDSRNDGTTWYTLSSYEWVYLLNTRDNASSLMGTGEIYDSERDVRVHGFILLPDNWVKPKDCTFQPGFTSGNNFYNNNNLYIVGNGDPGAFPVRGGKWEEMEAAGAVFLPAAGNRHSAGFAEGNGTGSYWSSSVYFYSAANYSGYAFGLGFHSDHVDPDAAFLRCDGLSVRLVKDYHD